METKAIDLNYLQNKLSKVRKSCVTPEQKDTFKRYRELYEEKLERYQNDFNYRVKVDFIMMIVSSYGVAAIIGIALFGLLIKIFGH